MQSQSSKLNVSGDTQLLPTSSGHSQSHDSWFTIASPGQRGQVHSQLTGSKSLPIAAHDSSVLVHACECTCVKNTRTETQQV